MNYKQSKKKDTIPKWVVIGIFIGVILLWAGSFFFTRRHFGSPENPGVFGDMFGAVNALFSGLAFWGVIYAILLQRIELKLQRQELDKPAIFFIYRKKYWEAINQGNGPALNVNFIGGEHICRGAVCCDLSSTNS